MSFLTDVLSTSSAAVAASAFLPSETHASPVKRAETVTYTYTDATSTATYTYVVHKQPRVMNAYYGWLSLLAVATVMNACFIAWALHRRFRGKAGAPSGSAQPNGRLSLRRLPHAILTWSRIVGFRLRIPRVEMNLIEFALSIMYLAGCLAFTFAPTDNVKPYVHLQPNYIGAKSGLIAAGQMPLAVFLALKNNPITWLTGIGHEKLILMHRIVSRCILVCTWIHFVGEYYSYKNAGVLYELIDEGWEIAGAVAAVAQTITTIFGIKQIRHRYYEIFYSSHVALILIFVICMHIHLIPMLCPYYIWPIYIIWGFDRGLRAARYLLFNVILRPKSHKALVEHIGADGLRVTLKRRIPGGWTAGQHVFLAFPKLGVESHPFTIGNIYEKEEGDNEAEMVFIIRAMGGQTRTLLDRAMKTGSCELTAFFDGPYGHPEDIRPFTTCIFIAGGTGVTYTIARMHQLFKDVQASKAHSKRVVFVWAVRTETEYEWVATDIAKVVALVPSSISLLVEVYLTGEKRDNALQGLPDLEKDDVDVEKDGALTTTSSKERSSSRSSSNEKADVSGASTPTKPAAAYFASGATTPTTACADGSFAFPRPGIVLKSGRPDVRTILEEEITTSAGAVAVDVSGPDGLVDAVRSSLTEPFAGPVATMRGTPTVLLSVEQFRM
ncbi:ferric reductase NAD binding domain-containing protein [Cubamyces lactineus]|nr:ferric reductase NAD binding domain-containing protein [Cubamyces lactineus]